MKKHILLKIVSTIIFWNVYGMVFGYDNYYLKGVTNEPQFNQDTIKQLHRNIIMNKEKFKHKTLNILLNELHLTVKSYSNLSSNKPGGPTKGIMLFFESPANAFNKMHGQKAIPYLVIYFENEIPRIEEVKLFSKTLGEWSSEAVGFYGPMIVRNIDENNKQGSIN